MIEQAMYFALGFCVAGLAALLFLPAVTRRSTAMAREQVERQMPLSIEEIVAQRDLLRAEFAAERRKIEQTVERLEETRTGDLAELGRRAAMISNLDRELGDIKRARDGMEVELATTLRSHKETLAENSSLQKGLWDETGTREALERRLADLRTAHGALDAQAQSTAADLAATITALAEHRNRLELSERDLAQHRADLETARRSEALLKERLAELEDSAKDALATVADLRLRQAQFDETFSAADLAALRREVSHVGEAVVKMTDDSDEREAHDRQSSASVG